MPFASTAIRDRARKRIKQRVQAGEPCALCGRPIDLDLTYPHPESFTVDHITPSSHGGGDHIDGLRPSHAACNRSRGNQPSGTVRCNSGALET